MLSHESSELLRLLVGHRRRIALPGGLPERSTGGVGIAVALVVAAAAVFATGSRFGRLFPALGLGRHQGRRGHGRQRPGPGVGGGRCHKGALRLYLVLRLILILVALLSLSLLQLLLLLLLELLFGQRLVFDSLFLLAIVLAGKPTTATATATATACSSTSTTTFRGVQGLDSGLQIFLQEASQFFFEVLVEFSPVLPLVVPSRKVQRGRRRTDEGRPYRRMWLLLGRRHRRGLGVGVGAGRTEEIGDGRSGVSSRCARHHGHGWICCCCCCIRLFRNALIAIVIVIIVVVVVIAVIAVLHFLVVVVVEIAQSKFFVFHVVQIVPDGEIVEFSQRLDHSEIFRVVVFGMDRQRNDRAAAAVGVVGGSSSGILGMGGSTGDHDGRTRGFVIRWLDRHHAHRCSFGWSRVVVSRLGGKRRRSNRPHGPNW